MALGNSYVMVEKNNSNNSNSFEMVQRPGEIVKDMRMKRMGKQWKKKAKAKANSRTKRMTTVWKSKARSSARRREQPLSRTLRKSFVGPRGKKSNTLSKKLLKQRAKKRAGFVEPKTPVRSVRYPEFKTSEVRKKLSAKGKTLRARGPSVTLGIQDNPQR